MKDLGIYIPSYNRYNVKQAYTLEELRNLTNIPIFVIVRRDQRQHYQSLLSSMEMNHVELVTVNKPGACAARNLCVQTALANKHYKMVMLDDDLKFFYREWTTGPDDKPTLYRTHNRPRYIRPVFDFYNAALDHYAHAAVSMKFANVYQKENVVDNVRGVRAVGYRVDILNELKLKFELDGREGMHMTLRLMEAGYPNQVSFAWAQESCARNVFDKNNASTLEWSNTTATLFQKAHPRLVQTVKKYYNSGERIEVRVAWRNAMKGVEPKVVSPLS